MVARRCCVAYVAASRITGPVRTLVGLVERARDGSYSGAVAVQTPRRDRRPGAHLQRLLADLREKEQMIGFLREGMTDDDEGRGRDRRARRRRQPGGGGAAAADATPAADRAGPVAATGGALQRGEPLRRPLRDPGHARQGRHGRRVPRARPPARRGGGAQGAARRGARRTTRRCSTASSRRSSSRAASPTGTSCAPTTSARRAACPTSRWSTWRASRSRT